MPSIYALLFFFSLASRPTFILSRMFSRSLSSFSLVTTTLDGATPSGMDWPLDFSRTRRSTWMMSVYSVSLVLSQTLLCLDSRTLQSVHGCDLALTTLVGTSNNCDLVVFADRDRADVVFFAEFLEQLVRNWRERGARDCRTLLRGALMMLRRTLDGALK